MNPVATATSRISVELIFFRKKSPQTQIDKQLVFYLQIVNTYSIDIMRHPC